MLLFPSCWRTILALTAQVDATLLLTIAATPAPVYRYIKMNITSQSQSRLPGKALHWVHFGLDHWACPTEWNRWRRWYRLHVCLFGPAIHLTVWVLQKKNGNTLHCVSNYIAIWTCILKVPHLHALNIIVMAITLSAKCACLNVIAHVFPAVRAGATCWKCN